MSALRVPQRLLFAIQIVGLLLLASFSAAQPAVTPARIGFVTPVGRSSPHFDAFRQGLADLGYVEGKNIVIEARFAEGRYERFPEFLAELIRLHVDVVAVTGAVTARAAMKTVTDIPIVFAVVLDPVSDGVVTNLEHPGGNLTGTTSFDPQQAAKQLALLKDILPTIKRVGILGDQGVSRALITASEAAAQAMGLEAIPIRVSATTPPLTDVFATLREKEAEALLVLEEPVLGVLANDVAAFATRERLPTVFAPSRVAAGGLITFGTSQVQSIRRMATYVDRILKGARPADLPVERVAPYELVINLKTARAIGVQIPANLVARADRIIE